LTIFLDTVAACLASSALTDFCGMGLKISKEDGRFAYRGVQNGGGVATDMSDFFGIDSVSFFVGLSIPSSGTIDANGDDDDFSLGLTVVSIGFSVTGELILLEEDVDDFHTIFTSVFFISVAESEVDFTISGLVSKTKLDKLLFSVQDADEVGNVCGNFVISISFDSVK